MLVFRPVKGTKPFITWNKSGDSLQVEMYGGRKYFLVETYAMGYVAIGKLNQSRTTFFVQIPRFSKVKIIVQSDSDNFLAIFHVRDQSMFRFMPGDSHAGWLKDSFISAEGIDGSGNLYILKQTAFDRFAGKKKKNYFVIRKRDFAKL
ncbi:MAG: hypothetical protein NT175_02920, partial [Bacteroidetes bacterium]|nr:hypothetical protein [Bacteroidota bacterium]